MIIGITGRFGGGKDSVANYLSQKGFKHLSLSDILREELRAQGKEVTREHLMDIGNRLREHFGSGVLAKRALAMIDHKHDWVISSIGTTGEIDVLKEREDFSLIFVDAPPRIRWQRIKTRKREQDPSTYKEFERVEKIESKGGGKHYRSFDQTKKLADIILLNNATLEQLNTKIDRLIHDLKHKRPTWDDYFMEIVDAVGRRGTCDRGKSGCVIAKNNRIITTGYVGSPVGLPHCDDEGHLYHEVIAKDGKVSKHCIRTIHAEQNAIAQAARHGLLVDGGTCYVTMEPCFVCAKILINAGIKRVVAKKRYHGAQLTRETLARARIPLVVLEDEMMTYPDMGSHVENKK